MDSKTISERLANIPADILSDFLEADLTRVNRDDFRKALGLMPTEYEIMVDYGLTLEEMISIGCYDWVDPNITAKRFPIKGKGKIYCKPTLEEIDCNLSTKEVLALFKKRDKRPAIIPELLAFGAKYPDIQQKFPVVALGSSDRVHGHYRHVAYLDGVDSGRRMNLYRWGGVWGGYCRFLAFAK